MNRYALGLLLAASALGSSLVGCPGTVTSSNDACTALVDATNQLGVRCGTSVGASPEERNAAIRSCAAGFTAPGITIDSGNIDRCAAHLAVVPCDEIEGIDDPGAPCATPPGTLAAGAACAESPQCASRRCIKLPPIAGKQSFCGTCGNAIAEGQACQFSSSTERCVDGTTCVRSDDGGTSSPTGTCKAIVRVGEGAACGQGSTSSTTCAAGFECDDGKCARPIAVGGACMASNDCTSGAFCSSVSNVCTVLPKTNEPCPEGRCISGLFCTDAKTCVAPTRVDPGQPCDNKTIACKKGRCRTGASTPGDAGSSQTGVCPEILADGAPCTLSSSSSAATPECDEPAECYDGTCQVADGSKCK